jgi:hypothetical protein
VLVPIKSPVRESVAIKTALSGQCEGARLRIYSQSGTAVSGYIRISPNLDTWSDVLITYDQQTRTEAKL